MEPDILKGNSALKTGHLRYLAIQNKIKQGEFEEYINKTHKLMRKYIYRKIITRIWYLNHESSWAKLKQF